MLNTSSVWIKINVTHRLPWAFKQEQKKIDHRASLPNSCSVAVYWSIHIPNPPNIKFSPFEWMTSMKLASVLSKRAFGCCDSNNGPAVIERDFSSDAMRFMFNQKTKIYLLDPILLSYLILAVQPQRNRTHELQGWILLCAPVIVRGFYVFVNFVWELPIACR